MNAYHCPCGTVMPVIPDLSGQAVRCSNCGQSFVMPGSAAFSLPTAIPVATPVLTPATLVQAAASREPPFSLPVREPRQSASDNTTDFVRGVIKFAMLNLTGLWIAFAIYAASQSGGSIVIASAMFVPTAAYFAVIGAMGVIYFAVGKNR